MDRANYLNDGSIERSQYPLSNAGLDFIQEQAMLIHTAIANALGSGLLIIAGCTMNGSIVSSGFVCINNEILPFAGGVRQTKVRIQETVENITADYVTYRNCTVKRRVVFGSNAGGVDYNWSSFSRIISLKDLAADYATKVELEEVRANAVIPSGLIAIWKGSIQDIPQGWALCDGTKGTQDLTDKFVLGAGKSYPVKTSGGRTQVSLITGNLPPHNHGLKMRYSGYRHNDSGNKYTPIGEIGKDLASERNGSTNDTGSGTAFSIMPPYYALAYIMKL